MTRASPVFRLCSHLRWWWHCRAVYLWGELGAQPARKHWPTGQVQRCLYPKGTVMESGRVMDCDYWGTVDERLWPLFRWTRTKPARMPWTTDPL